MLGRYIKLTKSQNIPQLLLCSGIALFCCCLVRLDRLKYSNFSGIFHWGSVMGSGPVKGFNSEHVQEIITKKHDAAQNKIAKEDSETATFAAG